MKLISYFILMSSIILISSCDGPPRLNMTEGDRFCDYFMVYQVFGPGDRACTIVDSATMVSPTEAIAWQDGYELRLFAPEIRIHRQPCGLY